MSGEVTLRRRKVTGFARRRANQVALRAPDRACADLHTTTYGTFGDVDAGAFKPTTQAVLTSPECHSAAAGTWIGRATAP